MTEAIVVGGGLAGTGHGPRAGARGHRVDGLRGRPASADGVGRLAHPGQQRHGRADDARGGRRRGGGGLRHPAHDAPHRVGAGAGELPRRHRAADGLQVQTIRRADLYRVLRDEADRQGVPITYGGGCRRRALPGGGVRARFADGSEATGDLLIGADGLRSRTRTLIDPAARGGPVHRPAQRRRLRPRARPGPAAGRPGLLLRPAVLPRLRHQPRRRRLVVHQPAEPRAAAR